MTSKPTLVLGASPKPTRYSHLAVRRLREQGHPVMAVGRGGGMIDDTVIATGISGDPEVHTITMYLNAVNQREWEDRLLGLSPRRIIFNPGAENPTLALKAKARGIEVLDACTLVMLATGQF